jgi:hypothetical protein
MATTKTVAARQRIKSHLKKRGDEVEYITPSFALYWWYRLNHAVFRGILCPPKEIVCRNFRDGSYGWTKPTYGSDDVTIGIRRELEDRKQFVIVLVHEMVHQYEWVHFKKMSHGHNFYDWAPLIKRELNLPLSEYIDD